MQGNPDNSLAECVNLWLSCLMEGAPFILIISTLRGFLWYSRSATAHGGFSLFLRTTHSNTYMRDSRLYYTFNYTYWHVIFYKTRFTSCKTSHFWGLMFCIQTRKSEADLVSQSLWGWEDTWQISECINSLASRLGTSNYEALFFELFRRPLLLWSLCIKLQPFSLCWENFENCLR